MAIRQSNDAKEKMAIGAIANFFGFRYGRYNINRLFKTIGLDELPKGNKAEKISAVLMDYKKDSTLFATCLDTLIQYHQLSPTDIETLRTHTLRLGFDIKDKHVAPSTGREIVISEGKPYDVFRIIEKILLSAKNRICIIDPYVDHSLFSLYLSDVPQSIQIKILTTNMYGKFKDVAKIFKAQRGSFEVRWSDKIHDRNIIIDDRAWMFGQSIKSAGNKPVSIIEFEAFAQIETTFNRLWKQSKVVL